MPTDLGEVAGGIIGNKLYLMGEGSISTLGYDFSTGTWDSASALTTRPYPGHHHVAEVVADKLYLLGGLGMGMGKVQIYDPATDTWSLGADMPFATGSSSAAVIGGQIYAAGGIVGSSTSIEAARYDPAIDTWTEIAPMKQGRNHAAAATDGTKLYVFGGRGPGSGDANEVANGFATVQVYDPTTDTWASSEDFGSAFTPLPQARGGMGKAVYHGGEFYVIGGETRTGANATDQGVYDLVDVYNPTTNEWRTATSMPSARHGIYPLMVAGRIYVAGGGVRAGASSSSLLEIYNVDKFGA
jgi:N-acetylneuraminic acid mutarotase